MQIAQKICSFRAAKNVNLSNSYGVDAFSCEVDISGKKIFLLLALSYPQLIVACVDKCCNLLEFKVCQDHYSLKLCVFQSKKIFIPDYLGDSTIK